MITVEQISGRDLMIFGRDKNGKRYTEKIRDFKPYFYDDKKQRVYVEKSSDVPHFRRMYPRTFEADIPYTQRFLIDRYNIPFPDEPLRICYMDIEVANACLDTKGAGEPIMSICCYDTILKKYVTFVWRADLEPHVERRENWSIFYFNKEEELLMCWIDFVEDTDPDVLTGWNVDRYDLTYLINRCHLLHININKISPTHIVEIQERMEGRYVDIKVGGKVVLDLLKAYRKLNLNEISSYSLEYVAKIELGLDKGKPYLRDMWEDIEKLITYNKSDVELCVKIDEKKFCIEFFNNLRRLTGSIWGYVHYFSSLNDVLLLRKAKERGEVLPSKPEYIPGQTLEEEDHLKGGFVLDTIPGVHRNVFVMDLKSIYPSIIRQFNLSYETIDNFGDYKLGNNICFKSEPEGIIPATIQYLIGERDKVKEHMREYKYGSEEYKALFQFQFAMKFVINAMYGATSYPRFRLYNPKVASSITWLGRAVVKWTRDIIEKNNPNLKVIYSDTDSVFVEILNGKSLNLDEILRIADEIQKLVNNSYEEFCHQFMSPKNKYLKNEMDKVYSSILFTKAKKRYVGYIIFSEDKKVDPPYLSIVGFETRRSDFNIFGKEIQTTIFKMVLSSEGTTKKQVDEYIKKKKEEIITLCTNDKKKINDLALPKALKKNPDQYKTKPAQVKAAEYANKYLGEQLFAGDKMKFLYVEYCLNKPQTEAICYSKDCPDGIHINWDKMFQVTINNKVEKVYEAMGWVKQNAEITKWFK